MIVLDAIIKNPGLNRESLAERINDMHNTKNPAIIDMFLDGIGENSRFDWLIKNLYCVEEKNGLFYFNEKLSFKDDIFDSFIQGYIKDLREKKIKKEVLEYGENIKPH